MAGMARSTGPFIILVEDNQADVFLLEEALHAEAPSCEIQVLVNGEQAYRFFSRKPPYTEARRPDLIILDFNLPGRNGGALTTLIRQTAELQGIPVALLSSAPKSYLQANARGADAFFTKPLNLDEFYALGKSLLQIWYDSSRA